MFFIPGWLISLATFPGVIIHEWAHKKFCDWNNVKVHKVVYFRIGNPAGYVIHEPTIKYNQIFWVSNGPLIINSLVAVMFSHFAAQIKPENFLHYLLLWTAVSAGMQAFPSGQDTKHILNASKASLKEGGSIFHYLAYPFYWLIWLANILRFVWFDLWYAVALVSIGGVL